MQTDLFNTRATNRYLVAIGVPVIVNNEVRYSLQAGISPEAIGRLLRRQALGEGWVAALLDSQGIIAGRTREESRFIGHPAVPSLRRAIENRAENTLESTTKEGAPVFTAFTHTSDGKWAVAVGAPANFLWRSLSRRWRRSFWPGSHLLALASRSPYGWRVQSNDPSQPLLNRPSSSAAAVPLLPRRRTLWKRPRWDRR